MLMGEIQIQIQIMCMDQKRKRIFFIHPMDFLFQKKERKNILPAKQVISPAPLPLLSDLKTETFSIDNLSFKRIIVNLSSIKSNYSTQLSKSDLITDVYEGGFKLWECCIDIIRYFETNNFQFSNKHVLDLGCGHGYPGIYALSKGAIVDFQDYNEEVLIHTTIPCVSINCPDQFSKARFFSGDWSLLRQVLDTKYDYIFTTDTIYSVDNHEILAKLIEESLQVGGECYVGAKSYYFGVGGGTQSFLDSVAETTKLVVSDRIKLVDGKSNIREIINLTL